MTWTSTYGVAADLEAHVDTGVLWEAIDAAAGIPTAIVCVDRIGDVLNLVFAVEPPAAEMTVLDGDVSGPAGGLLAVHALATAKVDQLAIVDVKTDEIIAAGFTHGGSTLPMDQAARLDYHGYFDFQTKLNAAGYFPFDILALDRLDVLAIADLAALDSFIDSFLAAWSGALEDQCSVQEDIGSQVTVAAVEAVVDPR